MECYLAMKISEADLSVCSSWENEGWQAVKRTLEASDLSRILMAYLLCFCFSDRYLWVMFSSWWISLIWIATLFLIQHSVMSKLAIFHLPLQICALPFSIVGYPAPWLQAGVGQWDTQQDMEATSWRIFWVWQWLFNQVCTPTKAAFCVQLSPLKGRWPLLTFQT